MVEKWVSKIFLCQRQGRILFKFIPNICTIRTWKLDCYILLIISMALVKFNLGAKLIISIKYPMYIRKIVSNYLSPNCYNKKKKQSLK